MLINCNSFIVFIKFPSLLITDSNVLLSMLYFIISLPFLFKGATDGHLTPELTDPLFSQKHIKNFVQKGYLYNLHFEKNKYEANSEKQSKYS